MLLPFKYRVNNQKIAFAIIRIHIFCHLSENLLVICPFPKNALEKARFFRYNAPRELSITGK